MYYSSLIGVVSNTAVGIIMLLATFTKYMRPNVFTRQIREYQILPIRYLIPTAFIIMGLELVLGTMLLMNYLTPVSNILTIGLLSGFLGLLWVKRDAVDNCGCFSSFIQRTPRQAIIEDMVMILLLVSGMALTAHKPLTEIDSWKHVIIGVVAVISIGAFFLYRYGNRYYPRWFFSRLRKGNSIQNLELSPAVNWENDNVLLAVLSTKCPFCKTQMPVLNATAKLMDERGEGRVVAVFSEKDAENIPPWFESEVQVCTAKQTPYVSLIALGVPCSAWVTGGSVAKVWSVGVPLPWEYLNHQEMSTIKRRFALELLDIPLDVETMVEKQLFVVLFEEGQQLMNEGNIKIAEKMFQKATETATQCEDCIASLVGKCYFNLAVTQVHLESLLEASKSFKEAASYFEKAEMYENIADAYARAYVMAMAGNNSSIADELLQQFTNTSENYTGEVSSMTNKFNDVCNQMINIKPI